jgi:hypothetical protein
MTENGEVKPEPSVRPVYALRRSLTQPQGFDHALSDVGLVNTVYCVLWAGVAAITEWAALPLTRG